MNRFFKYSLLVAGLAIGGSSMAHATPSPLRRQSPPSMPQVAPEIDPSLAFSAIALMGGTLTVVRARGRK